MKEIEPITYENGHDRLEFERFLLDTRQGILARNGEPIRISPKALEILTYLALRSNEVVKKDELIRSVWPDSFVEEANLAVHVSALCKMFANYCAEEVSIETFPKVGYRLTAEVRSVQGSSDGNAPVRVGQPVDYVTELPGSVTEVDRASNSGRRRILLASFLTLGAFVTLILIASRPWKDDRPGLSMSAIAGAESFMSAAFSPGGDHVAVVKRISGRQTLLTIHKRVGAACP